MRHAGLLTLVAGLALAGGCSDMPGVPDAAAPMDGDIGDADARPSGAGGIVLEFRARPRLPGDVGGPFEVELDKADLRARDLRIVGDAPVDERTRRDMVMFTWAQEIEEVAYPDAPVGLYTRVLGSVQKLELNGSVRLGEERVPFEVELEDSVPIAIELGAIDLTAGETRTIRIDVELGPIVRDLPWDTVELEEGKLSVEDDSPLIDSIEDAVAAAFDADAPSSDG